MNFISGGIAFMNSISGGVAFMNSISSGGDDPPPAGGEGRTAGGTRLHRGDEERGRQGRLLQLQALRVSLQRPQRQGDAHEGTVQLVRY
jgi:hypothetical protein